MPNGKKNKIFTAATLTVIACISLMLHLWRISYPDRPVFDEVFFASFASDYIYHEPYLGVHPPFGNLIYASTIFLTSRDDGANAQFFNVKKASGNSYLPITYNNLPYHAFPYVSLRIVSALFGAALPVVFYSFLVSIGVSTLGSLIGAGMIVLENALLLQTRLILIDGMYLVFGFAALIFYVKKYPKPFAAGIFWGLSLGIKLNAVVFAAPMAIWYVLQRRTRNATASLAKCIITGGLVCLFIMLTTNIFFSPQQRFDLWYSLGLVPSQSTPLLPLLASIPRVSDYVLTSAIETTFSLSGYVTMKNKSFPLYSSPWYKWLFMKGRITYYGGDTAPAATPAIILTGNPVIWYASTLAVGVVGIMLIWWLVLRIRRSVNKNSRTKTDARENTGIRRPLVLLFGGYIFSLLPFFTIIHRSTYLYHYFPALIFSIGILAVLISDKLKLDNFDTLTPCHILLITFMFIPIIFGFVITAPSTYGFLPLLQ